MNVLQRKMFANGDAVNSPVTDLSRLIANYATSGLSPLQIFEVLQQDFAQQGIPMDVGLRTIERIAKEVGGPMKDDPMITDPPFGGPRPLTPGRLDEMAQGPFDTSVDIAPDRLPPADPSLDPRLGTYAQQGDTLNPATTPDVVDFSEDLQGLMDTDITVEGDEQSEKKLGPNEIRLSDGRVIDFSQGIKDIQEGRGKGAFIYRIFNSPDIETGENVDKALTQFINVDEPGAIRFFGELGGGTLEERRGTAFGPEDIGSGLIAGAKGLFDFGREGLATIIPGAISPFVGRETVENVREFFDADFPEGYAARGGYSPETIDNIVLSAAGIKEDKIAKDLEEIGITEDKQTPIKPEVEVFEENVEEVEGEPESVADAAVAGKPPEVKDQPDAGDQTDAGAGLPGAVDEEVPPPPKSKEVSFAEFTTSPDFLRFVRNIGKGLVTTGEIGKGIALGSAAAAEERAQEEALKAERDAELFEKLAESGKLEFKDRKDILAEKKALNTSVRDYNNAIAAEELAKSVLDFAKDGNLTTFASKIGAKVSDLKKAFTGEPGELSDTKRAQIALDILTNRNIKEILGESGRTISNIDRDIAQRIVGNLNLAQMQSVEEIRERLQDNIKSIVQKKNEAQRNIKASVIFLAPYGNEAPLDKEIITIFMSELGQTLPQGSPSTYTPTPGVTFYDATQ